MNPSAPTTPAVRCRTRVKFCGLVRAQDVDTAVALGVDAVGLVFYARSPRALDEGTAAALRRRLPSFVRAVGLFVNEPPEQVRRVRARVGLDVVQLHGDETRAQLVLTGGVVWRAVRIGPQTDVTAALEALAGCAEFALLDTLSSAYGGTGTAFDWSLVPPGSGPRIILSGGLDEQTVGAGIHALQPTAVDVSSAIQGADPRTKDTVRMERFMAAVAAADAACVSAHAPVTS